MKLKKRILSFFIVTTTLIVSTSTLSSSASTVTHKDTDNYGYSNDSSTEKKDETWVLTNEVPSSIIEFGVNYFLSCSESELLNLGFSENEIDDLSITSPITTYKYEETDLTRYYFPIISKNEIIAHITVSENETETYSIQMGKTNFARNLNEIKNTSNSAIAIITTNDTIFSLNSSNKINVIEHSYFMKNSTNNSFLEPDISLDEIEGTYQKKICLNNSVLRKYTQNVTNNNRSIEQRTLNVPVVPNASTGICWASSLASIIKYSVYLPMTEIQLRDALVNSGYGGYDYQAKSILDSYLHTTTTIDRSGMLSYNTIKASIDNGMPIYTDWQDFIDTAHAMVVNGYYYNSSIPVPYAIHVSIMDPNEATYQTFGLIPGTYYQNLTWYSSVY